MEDLLEMLDALYKRLHAKVLIGAADACCWSGGGAQNLLESFDSLCKHIHVHHAPQALLLLALLSRPRRQCILLHPLQLAPRRRILLMLAVNLLWYRGGLVFEAHRLVYHSA